MVVRISDKMRYYSKVTKLLVKPTCKDKGGSSMIKVEKRDGSIVGFDSSKIFSAISKAFDSLHMEKDDAIINLLVLRATADFQTKIKDNRISVEMIQDSVEKNVVRIWLLSGRKDIYFIS